MVAIDIGGTFTDAVGFDTDTGRVWVAKVPSTPADPAKAFILSVAEVLSEVDDEVPELILHGTTVGTNALLQHRGGTVGLITTRGFRDIIELGRRTRPQNYGLFGRYEPLVPREHRFEITERMTAAGDTLVPVAQEELAGLGKDIAASGADAVAIVLLHSYRNPAHEIAIGEYVRAQCPDVFVTLSHEVLPERREFERTTTSVANAFLQPVMSDYLQSLDLSLTEQGYDRGVLVMQSNGGVIDTSVARKFPVRTVLSGPAGGVVAAARYGAEQGFRNVIAGDVGGTSFDVTLIKDGRPAMSVSRELEYNLPLRVPMIDIATIGAGGGSIAWVDAAGLLQVGPQSAGARPGPVAFRRGGTEPTVTDANVFLGRLNAQSLLGVPSGADVEGVSQAISSRVAEPLDLSVTEAAVGILAVANTRMAAAISSVSLERGYDPREFAYVAFGGAGGLMAVDLCKEVGIPKVLVPPFPGVTSALGVLMADLRLEYSQSVSERLSDMDFNDLEAIFDSMIASGTKTMRDSGELLASIDAFRTVEMYYEGQTHSVVVDVPAEMFVAGADARDSAEAELAERFDEVYLKGYGLVVAQGTRMVSTARVSVVGRREAIPVLGPTRDGGDGYSMEGARKGSRKVWMQGDWIETPVYDRHLLPWSIEFEGPAILEQVDSTTVAYGDTKVTVDSQGMLILEV
jgi:N-methylhydantoinase A